MRKDILSLLCAWLFTIVVSAQKQVTIDGSIPKLPDGTVVLVNNYAVYGHTKVDEALDKCAIKNGKFSLKFTIKEPRQVVVWVERPHSNRPIVVVPGDKVTINADKPHMLFQADVVGAKMDEAFSKIRELPYKKDRPQNDTGFRNKLACGHSFTCNKKHGRLRPGEKKPDLKSSRADSVNREGLPAMKTGCPRL